MVNKTDNNMSSVSMIQGNADPKDLLGESSMENIDNMDEVHDRSNNTGNAFSQNSRKA